METIKVIKLEQLTPVSVCVVINEFIEIDGKQVPLGNTQRACFNNIPHDRSRIQEILPSQYVNAILAMWGDTPSSEDPISPVV